MNEIFLCLTTSMDINQKSICPVQAIIGQDTQALRESLERIMRSDRPSYSQISLVCCAISSHVRTNRRGHTSPIDPKISKLLPGIKPFFFHSLVYDPDHSCKADEVIAENWESLSAYAFCGSQNSRRNTDVQNPHM